MADLELSNVPSYNVKSEKKVAPILFNSIQFIRNVNHASKRNKHTRANKRSYIKARPLRKLSKCLLFFSFL